MTEAEETPASVQHIERSSPRESTVFLRDVLQPKNTWAPWDSLGKTTSYPSRTECDEECVLSGSKSQSVHAKAIQDLKSYLLAPTDAIDQSVGMNNAFLF